MRRDREKIKKQYRARLALLQKLADGLQAELKEILRGVANVDRISFRAKQLDSFIDKALSQEDDGRYKYAHPLEEIEDQIGGRALVFYRSDISAVIEALEGRWRKAEQTNKRPASPKAFDYETTHRICVITPDMVPSGWRRLREPPQTFELQIRTLAQHAWSEPQHEVYKRRGGLKPESMRKLYWAAASAWGIDTIWEELREELATLNRRH